MPKGRVLSAVASLGLFGAVTAGLVGIFALPGRPTLRPEPVAPRRIVSDFNRDGASDHLQLRGGTLSIQLGDSQAPIELHKKIVGFATADIDNDGDADVLAISAKGTLHVWRNDGHGRFGHSKVSLPRRGAIGRGDAELAAGRARDAGVEPNPQRLFAPALTVARYAPPQVVRFYSATRVSSPSSVVRSLLPARAPPVRLSA